MEETVFFDQNDVSVSNARFIVRGQTYAMNGITSVKKTVKDPPRMLPILLGAIGLVVLFNSVAVGNKLLGGAIVVAALFWLFSQRPEYIVLLHSSSGEMQALASTDRAYIESVIEALNRSIVHRG
jgi:hypothetical protein